MFWSPNKSKTAFNLEKVILLSQHLLHAGYYVFQGKFYDFFIDLLIAITSLSNNEENNYDQLEKLLSPKKVLPLNNFNLRDIRSGYETLEALSNMPQSIRYFLRDPDYF